MRQRLYYYGALLSVSVTNMFRPIYDKMHPIMVSKTHHSMGTQQEGKAEKKSPRLEIKYRCLITFHGGNFIFQGQNLSSESIAKLQRFPDVPHYTYWTKQQLINYLIEHNPHIKVQLKHLYAKVSK